MKNFKSIREATLSDLGSFNILVGKNNSGKSTILDAIQLFLARIAQSGGSEVDDHVWTNGIPENPILFRALVRLDKEDLEEAEEIENTLFWWQ